MHPAPLHQLTAWLNDAYAMERALAKVLESHVRDAGEIPEIRARLEDHRDETRRHAQQVETCLALLGEKPSFVKTAWNSLSGKSLSPTARPWRDDLTKNLLADYTTEHLEIASYRALITAARELGQTEIAEICTGILTEETAMARWLEEHIPVVTRISLQQFMVRS